MVTLRAGWISFIRLHGVTSASGDGVLPVQLRGAAQFVCSDFRIVLATNLTIPVNFPTSNWLAVEGGPDPKPRNSTTIREDDPPGIWLQIILSRDYDVADDTAKRFIDSRGEELTTLDAVLGEGVDRHFAEVGVLVSAAAVTALEPSQPHLRATGRVYWWDSEHYAIRVLQRVIFTLVPALAVNDHDLAQTAGKVAPLLAQGDAESDKKRRPLVLAARWLLAVSDLPPNTNERFVTYVQALEALTGTVDSSPAFETLEAFTKLEELVSSAPDTMKAQVANLLARVREYSLGPPLRERFQRLARQFNPTNADADVEAFAAMVRLRNDLLHARITSVPQTHKGYNVEDTLRRLSFTYFELLTQALASKYQVSRV